VSGWQPIETVPQDGTDVLCGRFVQSCPHKRNGFMAVDYWRSGKRTGYTGLGHFNAHYWPATHWMPLPEPPNPQPERV
jgi:hypothetical protein